LTDRGDDNQVRDAARQLESNNHPGYQPVSAWPSRIDDASGSGMTQPYENPVHTFPINHQSTNPYVLGDIDFSLENDIVSAFPIASGSNINPRNNSIKKVLRRPRLGNVVHDAIETSAVFKRYNDARILSDATIAALEQQKEYKNYLNAVNSEIETRRR
jgi:hypothetical protein